MENALAYSGDTHEIIDVFHAIIRGDMQLWAAEQGCLVTEIIVYPRKKVLHIFLAGGKLECLTDMHNDVIEWAKLQGCSALSLSGRMGWKKALERFDWKPKYLTLVKEF